MSFSINRNPSSRAKAGGTQRLCRVLLSVAALCSCGWAQNSQDKPLVQVSFKVMAQKYLDHFSASEIHKIEAATQQALIDALNKQIPFLAFTTESRPCQLTIALKYSDLVGAGAGPRRDTIFSLQMTMPGQNAVSDNTWLYQGWIHDWEALSNAETTSADIKLSFEKLPVDQLVEKVLSHIALSPTAHLVWKKTQAGATAPGMVAAIVIPIPASQLCMDNDSRLALDGQFAGDFGSQPVEAMVVPQGEFHPTDPSLLPDDVGHLFGIPFRGSPADQPWSVLDSATADKVSVKGIFVREYRPLDTGCDAIVQPSNSGLTGGGQ